MRTLGLLILILCSTLFTFPSLALECANVGFAWTTQPDDTGDATATACGDGAVADGSFSTALGYLASSVGNGGVALGQSASSGGSESTALGRSAGSAGTGSTAVGANTSAGGFGSTALGLGTSAAGSYSTAIGYRASAPNLDTIVLGEIPGVNGGNNYTAVANGTTAPLAPLHIFRDDGTAQVLVEEADIGAVPRTLFRLASAGSNTKFEIDNTMAGINWAFTNSGSDFRISRQGSGAVEFRVDNAGNAYVLGDLEVGGNLLTNVLLPSDRGRKRNVEALDPEDVLEKVAALPVTAWEYSDRPGERHIGPMAQDFHAAFGLGSGDEAISVVDASGVALASIKALNEKLERQNRELATRNAELEERLALLETMMTSLLPQTAQK